ncbi:MAG: ATP:cob(I)alamin adenosyltransferase, partial [Bacteroidaceae bacterium]|nr:ATP:cob(I)alamin adenosyltransferase [Bacteroidaceae bacterium]
AEVDTHVIAYVNRLSDYLFVLARKLNADQQHDETLWVRQK